MYLKFREPNFIATTSETRSGPKPLEDAFHAMKTDISNLEHPSHNSVIDNC